MTTIKSIIGMREFLDDDGENLAVRAFLQLYGGTDRPDVGDMRQHLVRSGFAGLWPDWVAEERSRNHLAKAGAQDWLRYLFALEDKAKSGIGSQEPPAT